MDIKLMPEEQLKALLATLPGKDIDSLVKLYLKLRTGKSAIAKHAEAVDGQFKEVMGAIENHLLQRAQEQGVTGFKVDGVGTTYTSEEMRVSIANDAEFFPYVLKQESPLDFFERRVSTLFLKEHMKLNGGTPPPGLNIFRENVMRVRKATDKPTKGESK